ncbi:ornithine cyclodeaminase family protein [Propylenella binzhouense]|uniref:Ornithine cyclodeaminase family protein n=1 Tax=Propylenella binzhouense TaxID=2555902 RepID=A0A964T2E2_9HYPH|nr:ornithine cyclodeaminase family protein [Propylenella binzhouense]MYZ47115.1 ornithine cyclodeaminase family protein [Propylenella binzhouense]
MSEVLLLRPNELLGLVSMAEAIDAVAAAYAGGSEYPVINAPRRRVHSPEGVRVSNFPGGVHALGVIGSQTRAELVGHADAHQQYLRREPPVFVLNDSNTGELLAILVGEIPEKELGPSSLMAMRTGATSGVGFRHLVREDAKLAGLFGSGGQASHQLQALLTERPGIERVRVFGRDQANRERFAEEYGARFGVAIEPVASAEAVIDGADVVVCATNTSTVLFDGDLLQPGQHITGIIGSNMQLVEGGFLKTVRRELDDRTAEKADLIVANLRDSVMAEKQGDLYQPIEKGLIRFEDIVDLGEVALGRHPGRTAPDQLTYHKNNNGTGAADLAIAMLAFRKARELGRGMPLALAA